MPKRYLFLTGGLGNQIFQYAALQSTTENSSLHLDIVNGSPRVNACGNPDLLEFDLEDDPKISRKQFPVLTKRAIGYSLRLHISARKGKRLKIFRFIIRFATSFLVSLSLRELILVRVLEGLGDDFHSERKKVNVYLIGYFQSIRWANTLKTDGNLGISLKFDSEKILKYIRLAELEKPLIVHVRLGDYVAEGGFGVPGKAYYSEAISSQLTKKQYGKIWLFSDEPSNAVRFLPEGHNLEVRIIEDPELSSAETLEVMRMGHGYVIANSTFSYWGAFLSYTDNPPVICPYPWFKDIAVPRNLLPAEWESVDARF